MTMTNREKVLKEFNNVPSGQLIKASNLYREKFSTVMSETAFTGTISRLYQNGEIYRISKGIYCKPRKTRFGSVKPSDKEIVNNLISDNNGVIVGYELYNSLGITTQIAKSLTVYSSIIDEKLKQIGNITVHKYNLDYNSSVKATIRIMEVLKNYNKIEDINYSALIHTMKSYSKKYDEKAVETVIEVIGYPKRTVAFMHEMLNHYNVTNKLDNHLSALSVYRIPEMKDIFVAAEKQPKSE